MVEREFVIGDKVILKKKHACGGSEWAVARVGADIAIKCETCGRRMVITRDELIKLIKKHS